jgi:hypothetical protein
MRTEWRGTSNARRKTRNVRRDTWVLVSHTPQATLCPRHCWQSLPILTTSPLVREEPWQKRPQKLHFTTFPKTLMRWAVRIMPLLGVDPGAVGKNQDINLRAVLEQELPVTARIDIRLYYDVQQRAAACHSSQISGPGSVWGRLPHWLVRRWQSTETFYRATPSFQQGERRERDLFAGIT